MKFIRWFLTFNLAIILLVFIISLSAIYRTKNMIEKEIAVALVKELFIKSVKEDDINDEQKALIEKIVRDKQTDVVINRAVQNYLAFNLEDNFELSKEDYDILMDYITKYLDYVNTLSDDKYTEEELRNDLNYNNANEYIKEAFNELNGETSSEDIRMVLNIYSKITSANMKTILFIAIIVFILLITLINWSFFKWMIVMGIDLVISSIFFGTIYGLGLFAKSKIVVDETMRPLVNSINLKGLIILALCEFFAGVLLITAYRVIKKSGVNNG